MATELAKDRTQKLLWRVRIPKNFTWVQSHESRGNGDSKGGKAMDWELE